MTDAPLINMVARELRNARVTTFVPSTYTPRMLTNGDLGDTYIYKALAQLEKDRETLYADAATASKLLSKENYIVQNAAKYTVDDLTTALELSGQLQSLIASAQAIGTSIDTFETTLFGGQAPSQTQQQSQNPQASQQQGNLQQGNQQQGNQPQGNQQQANQQQGNTQQSNPQGNQQQQTPPAPSPSAQAGAMLSQILASDLLAHAILGDNDLMDAEPTWGHADMLKKFRDKVDGVNFLTVHALESGGTQLNKSNFFYGTHIYFGGGAVMTFSLYKVTGDLQCSGVAYNYEGYVREKHYDNILRTPQLPAIINTDFACSPGSNVLSPPSIGMTVSQVEAVTGSSYRFVEAKGNTYVYDFGQFRVSFRKGIVVKVTQPKS
jgi:hypothetical protein